MNLNTIIEEEVEAYKNDYAQAITDVGGFGLAKHIERFLTTAMQRAYKKGKADSTQENDPSYKFVANRISKPLVATKFVNTPDTEWEKWVRTLSNSTNPRDTDLLIAKIAVLLTSRDTYWKERVESVLIAMSWSEENETPEAIRVLDEIRNRLITNEDNLK